MNNFNVIAIDIAKNTFQACKLNKLNKVISNQSMNRKKLQQLLATQSASLVAMESCGSANYWARLAKSLGHQVMLIPPQQVKPFRTGQKTDANDAIAIAVAASAPNVKPARCMTVEQQCLQSISKMRELLNRQILQISNQMRGVLLEFGIVINQSACHFKRRIPEILEDAENELSIGMRESVAQMWSMYLHIEKEYTVMDNRFRQLTMQDETCKRLSNLEGVGPVGAAGLMIQLSSGDVYQQGRQASACVGTTPVQHSSGDRVIIGGVSKRSCNRTLRSVLFLGARSVVSKLKKRPAKTEKERWLKALLERRGVNIASMALANKNVRTAYSMLKHGTEYQSIPLT